MNVADKVFSTDRISAVIKNNLGTLVLHAFTYSTYTVNVFSAGLPSQLKGLPMGCGGGFRLCETVVIRVL